MRLTSYNFFFWKFLRLIVFGNFFLENIAKPLKAALLHEVFFVFRLNRYLSSSKIDRNCTSASGISEQLKDLTLDELEVIATLGIGGFGRVELVQVVHIKCLFHSHWDLTLQQTTEPSNKKHKDLWILSHAIFLPSLESTYVQLDVASNAHTHFAHTQNVHNAPSPDFLCFFQNIVTTRWLVWFSWNARFFSSYVCLQLVICVSSLSLP